MVDERVRAKAQELTRLAKTDDDRIQALYDFVSTEIRYVSLSFGVGRYSPHAAPDVLIKQYGDCKDKHTLLAAMLKAIGVEAWPALANGFRKMDPAMPSPAEFNHLLTVIPRGTSPAEWHWLDTTPGVAPYRMLLANLRDRDVLVVAQQTSNKAPGPILRTPPDPPFAMTSTIEVSGKVDTLGILRGAVRYTARGDEELLLRSLLLNTPPDKRIEVAKGMVEALKLDGGVSEFKATNVESRRHPLIVEFSVRRAGFFKWNETGATLTLPLRAMEFLYDSEGDWKNRARFKLSSHQSTLKATIELPASYTPTVPVGISLTRDAYTFSSHYRADAGRIVAERVLRTKYYDVAASSAPEYLAFVRAVRADEAQMVEVAFNANAAAEIPSDATAILKNDAWVRARLGAAYAGVRSADNARKAMEEAVRIEPSPAIWTYVSWQLAQHGVEMAWAEELSRKTLAHAANSCKSLTLTRVTNDDRDLVERVGWSWDAIGWIHFQHGNSQLAERYVKAAWMLLGEAGIVDHLGQIYEKQSRLSDAGSAYLTGLALDDDPTSPTVERARRVFGKNADLNKLIAAARMTAAMERAFLLKPERPIDGTAELAILLKPNGTVNEAHFVSGDEALRSLVTSVQAMTIRMQFPDDTIGQLPLGLRSSVVQSFRSAWLGFFSPATGDGR